MQLILTIIMALPRVPFPFVIARDGVKMPTIVAEIGNGRLDHCSFVCVVINASGDEVNLSASSVRRCLAAMRDAGIIAADVAVTDPSKRGLTFITSVSFQNEDPESYEIFRKQMTGETAVSQCYSVSGDFDFMLMVHAQSPAAYEKWEELMLMSNPAIGRYSTSIVWSRTKFTTRIESIVDSVA